jgi:UDP-N-acetylglucosamine diphosphorylase / glucose-1-phosphate thymidylyltransferase / UDP-N-acetylgalactosamine diphosphorylase / glucosamine-1-phosphate N-acetyltransferase / galactosamine-1-phosphate N-acetyltransferase
MGGNDWVDPSIYSELTAISLDWDGAILAKCVKDYFPGGYLQVDAEGRIQNIIEKPAPDQTPSNLVNIVGHFFKKSADLKAALANAKSEKDDVYEVALDQLFQSKKFRSVPYEGVWQAIKYPWHVLSMMEVFLEEAGGSFSPMDWDKKAWGWQHKKAHIDPSVVLEGPGIVIDSAARIMPFSKITGPVYIGKNTLVGDFSTIRHSMVGENSVMGSYTELVRSYCAPHVSTHRAYIGDSVVCSEVNFGAFSCTANLRLDKKNKLTPTPNKNKTNSQRPWPKTFSKSSWVNQSATRASLRKIETKISAEKTQIPPQTSRLRCSS